jgi:hypothetical protein
VKLEGKVDEWKGRGVSIEISEYRGNADRGSVYVATPAWNETEQIRKKKNAEQYRDKL